MYRSDLTDYITIQCMIHPYQTTPSYITSPFATLLFWLMQIEIEWRALINQRYDLILQNFFSFVAENPDLMESQKLRDESLHLRLASLVVEPQKLPEVSNV